MCAYLTALSWTRRTLVAPAISLEDDGTINVHPCDMVILVSDGIATSLETDGHDLMMLTSSLHTCKVVVEHSLAIQHMGRMFLKINKLTFCAARAVPVVGSIDRGLNHRGLSEKVSHSGCIPLSHRNKHVCKQQSSNAKLNIASKHTIASFGLVVFPILLLGQSQVCFSAAI